MKALIIIPTFNEVENIREIIFQALCAAPDIEILVVDDNSVDGTGALCDRLASEDPRIHILHRERKMGLGSAYVAGFRHALKSDYDCVFEMDADFSHDPREIPVFLEQIETSDIVLGSRYRGGVNVLRWPMKRLLLSYFANAYARRVTGVPVWDLTGGYKCFRRKVLEAVDLDHIHSSGYAFQIEMTFKAYHKGFRIVEIPIVFTERRKGASKMNRNIIWEAGWLVLRLRAQKILGRV
jgi:dolichol-phosphate mannosyltransferase